MPPVNQYWGTEWCKNFVCCVYYEYALLSSLNTYQIFFNFLYFFQVQTKSFSASTITIVTDYSWPWKRKRQYSINSHEPWMNTDVGVKMYFESFSDRRWWQLELLFLSSIEFSIWTPRPMSSRIDGMRRCDSSKLTEIIMFVLYACYMQRLLDGQKLVWLPFSRAVWCQKNHEREGVSWHREHSCL